MIPLFGISQTNSLKLDWGIKKDVEKNVVTMPYTTFLYLDNILTNYLEYKKIVHTFDKSDSVNKEILKDLSQVISNSENIQNNFQKNNEILLKENLELKLKVDTFTRQNKVMKKVIYFVAGFIITKYVLIPELKQL
jgi:hypothetical protein